nr:ferrochelatase [Salmonella enterica subsp. enterica serovar Give str. 564]
MLYTLHTSSCLCVGYARSPQSHSYLCSWGLTPLPPLSNSNYLGYRHVILTSKCLTKIISFLGAVSFLYLLMQSNTGYEKFWKSGDYSSYKSGFYMFACVL